MTELYIILTQIVLIIIFTIILYKIIIPKMTKEMKNFTWNQYFKKCGIYQGRSHWHDIYDLVFKEKILK